MRYVEQFPFPTFTAGNKPKDKAAYVPNGIFSYSSDYQELIVRSYPYRIHLVM